MRLLGKFNHNLSRLKAKTLSQSHRIEQMHFTDLETQKTRYETVERLLKGRSNLFLDAKPTKDIPFSRNPAFFGRADELMTIAAALEPSDSITANPTGPQQGLVLHGPGDMGKTETALEYAYRAFDKFDTVLWIAAETEQKASNSFVEAASSLGIPIDKGARAHDLVLKWLNSTHTSWLIVFDNAPDDNTSFLRDCWPVGRGSVLVTTRNACLAHEFSIPNDIALGPINEDVATRILTGGLLDNPTEDFRARAGEICHRLGYFPLALSQIAGYLVESGSDLDDFLETYRDFENVAVLHATPNPERAGPSLKVTGDFQYLTKTFPFQQSVRRLQNHNLITLDPLNDMIKIHRILQDSIMARLTQAQKINAFGIAVKILHEAFPSPELAKSEGFAKVCERGDQLYPHIIALLSKTALLYFDIAIRIYNRDRTENLIYLAQLQGMTRTIYRNSDNAWKSIEYFKEEIELYEEAIKAQQIERHAAGLGFHSDDKSGLLLALVNKSWAMWKSDLLNETAVLLESVIKEAQEILNINSEEYQARRVLAYGMRALGNVYIDQDRWDDAFNVHQRAFDFQVQTWGERHFETGVSCYKMAVHYERKGEIVTAIGFYESALVIFTDNPVPMKTHIIRTEYRLGHVLLSNSDGIRGVVLVEEAQKARQNLKEIPPDVDDSMESYDTLVPY
ncbi:hypothetical protein RRF57_002439 [Xylaria bambusicola]|uniref:NB-ARC domain-containing protein n=1 Tax=Xylaria bambusicola TaxID=326684 RepID=A0AAN7UD50_9PEZI